MKRKNLSVILLIIMLLTAGCAGSAPVESVSPSPETVPVVLHEKLDPTISVLPKLTPAEAAAPAPSEPPPREPVEAPSEIELLVLMYHSIGVELGSAWTISTERFENDLIYLRDNGYTTVTLRSLVDYVEGFALLPEKLVLITFDDGYANNLTTALPLLEKYDAHAVVSVIGTMITEPQEGKSPTGGAALDWSQVAELAESGRFEISSHTWDMHSAELSGRQGCAMLKGEEISDYSEDFAADNALLCAKLAEYGIPAPICFAYPYGKVSAETKMVLSELGYLVSVTSYEGMNTVVKGEYDTLFGLCRYNRHPDTTIEEILRTASR